MCINDLEEIGINSYITHDGKFVIYQMENKTDWVLKDKRNSISNPESSLTCYKGYIVKSIYDAISKMNELIEYA